MRRGLDVGSPETTTGPTILTDEKRQKKSNGKTQQIAEEGREGPVEERLITSRGVSKRTTGALSIFVLGLGF